MGTDETPPDAEAWAETIESAVQLEREPVLVYVLWRYAADAGKCVPSAHVLTVGLDCGCWGKVCLLLF